MCYHVWKLTEWDAVCRRFAVDPETDPWDYHQQADRHVEVDHEVARVAAQNEVGLQTWIISPYKQNATRAGNKPNSGSWRAGAKRSEKITAGNVATIVRLATLNISFAVVGVVYFRRKHGHQKDNDKLKSTNVRKCKNTTQADQCTRKSHRAQ